MAIDFSRSALIIIDVQNDFCPGGALGVEKGGEVIGPLNRLASLFAARGGRVVATQDWHPADHASFAVSHAGKKPGETVDLPGAKAQILWPCHCIQGSRGADFHAALDLKPVNLIIRKGFRTDLDSYSAFFENDRKTSTGLDGFLKALSIDTLVLGGLATDYCVLYSALDAVALVYKTFVAQDAVRGVDFPKGSVAEALKRLGEAGVIVTTTGVAGSVDIG
jgi:nicotinamidase/pyrazinamidase